MIRCLFALSVASIVLMSSGCHLTIFDRGEPGSGIIETEIRNLDSFKSVNLEGFGKVTVEFGEESKIELKTDDNLLKYVDTSVEGSELTISLLDSIRPSDGLDFKITMQDLEQFKVSGAGDVKINGFSGGDLELKASGAGEFTVDGVAESVSLNLSGAGEGSLSELIANQATIKISGAGNATVNVVESLSVNISGVGSVSYIGSPEISKSISGMGSVSQIRESNVD